MGKVYIYHIDYVKKNEFEHKIETDVIIDYEKLLC